MDFLASEALAGLSKTDMAASWIKDKEHEYKDMNRLAVLRSFSNFDSENLKAVCDQLGVSVADMQATLRVLSKI
jgi:DNA-binding MarR family transcriptional regulator